MLNAVIFVAVMAVMTFVLFLLFKWGVSAAPLLFRGRRGGVHARACHLLCRAE